MCLAAMASLISCGSNQKAELGTESVYEYYDASHTRVKSIGNYQAGAENQTKRPSAGLQLLEMYNRGEILSPLMESGLDSVFYSMKGSPFDRDGSRNSLPVIFFADETRRMELERYLSLHPEILKLFPEDMEFMWSAKAEKDFLSGQELIYNLYAVRHSKLTIGHADIAGCSVGTSQDNLHTISVSMTMEGAERWAEMTGNNLGRAIAITVDDRVYSAPMVRGAIKSGSSEISGNFTEQEALDLMTVINAFVLDGEWRSYHENGKLKEVRQYEKGEQVGEWSTYDENGKLIKTRGK